MVLMLLSLVVSICVGSIVVISALSWPDKPHVLLGMGLFLGVGLGLGIFSWLFFICLNIWGVSRTYLALIETAVLVVAFIMAWAKSARVFAFPKVGDVAVGARRTLQTPVWLAFGTILMSATVAIVLLAIRRPHGEADAWIQWNVRARFLFRGGERWTDLFSVSPLLHPDYPLLLPVLVARAWIYSGRESTIEPAVLSALYALATAGLLAAAVGLHRGGRTGALAGMLLLSTSSFITGGAAQVADIPLGFYFLATLVLLSLREVPDVAGPGALALAGVTASLAGWTKNEGMLFVLVTGASLVGAAAMQHERRPFRHSVLPFALGALPGLLVLFSFKVAFAPRNDVVSAQNLPLMVERMVDLERYTQVLAAVGLETIEFGQGASIVLLLYALLLGRDRGAASASAGMLALAVVGVMAAGYSAIYVITPHDLRWHLATSLERLLLQLWPSLIFAVFMLVRAPAAASGEG